MRSFGKFVCGILAIAGVMSVFAQSTRQLYLSGHDKDDAVPWKFFCTEGAQSGFWTNLVLPSNWELHGFGTLSYRRDATNPPPESGLYEHDFAVPSDWPGQRVFLVFDGVMTDTSARLNGETVGPMHQGSFYQFKYEVTSLLKFGATNRLEVRVDKHSANRSVNGAERNGDYWLFGGIFRAVHLDAVPPQFIERVAVDARADGAFAMDVFLNGVSNADLVEVQIATLDGKDIGAPFAEKASGPKISIKTHLPSPRLWTAETPNLYRVEVRLKQGDQIIHQMQQRFGFRTMEVRDGDGLYVNGHKVVLKGADRHSFWPDSGRCLSEAVHRLDIETMKDMNMNAVRMSHYPPDAQFLDLCDELGLYVLDELGGWHNHYDTEVGTQLVGEMVAHDVNHPSILFWDNGNEGGWNTNLDDVFGQFDPQQRQVLHPWAIHGGVNTGHYKPYDQAETLCAGDVIYMPTEFEHGLFDGGAGAGLEDYWRIMSASKVCAGGFIWALIDEGVHRPDNGTIDVAGNQAPDGILGPYRQREASFYTIKQIWSPIEVARETNGTFAVANHYSFTDASQCKFTWQLRRFSQPGETNSGFMVVREGVLKVPGIAPGERGEIQLNLPVAARSCDALALRVNDPNGRELWTWVWPLPRINERTFLREPAPQHAVITNTNGVIEVKSGGLAVTFSRETGLLTSVRRGPQNFSFRNGPRFTEGNGVLEKIETIEDGPDCIVSAKFASNLKSVSWRVNGNGWLRCDYTYTAAGAKDFMGVIFDYPEDIVKHKRWLGDGPYRVWKNRLGGVTLGVWENDYNNTITGWSGWIYPEFKGCFTNVRWLQLDTTEGLITVVPENVPFVQVFTPEFPPDKVVLRAKISLPAVGLAFLDAIPPVGSKFQSPGASGPQGQPNMASGEYSGSVSFYFGSLP